MMSQESFFSEEELRAIGFKSVGLNCKISRFAKFYGVKNISIGNNVRIDDYSIISGHVTMGNNIHISAYVALYGSKSIVLEDYTGISAKSIVYSAMDDFGGDFFIGPIHLDSCTNVTGGKVLLKKYSQIGANTVVFPNLTIGEGTVVGACSMVKHSLDDWSIFYGVPAKFYKKRNKGLLNFVLSDK